MLLRPYATAVANTLHGVVKAPSPARGVAVHAQACGVARLDADGDCVVLLPPEFPDPQWADASAAGSSRRRGGGGTPDTGARVPPCPNAPFTVAYHLTPLGHPMPNVHVATEVTRLGLSIRKGGGKGAGVDDGPSPRVRVADKAGAVVLTADTGAKGAAVPRGAGRPVLCFVVRGGVPGGRVSWLLTTTPKLPGADVDAALEPAARAPVPAPAAGVVAKADKPDKPDKPDKHDKLSKLHRRSASMGWQLKLPGADVDVASDKASPSPLPSPVPGATARPDKADKASKLHRRSASMGDAKGIAASAAAALLAPNDVR